jgi:hypothetical protein
MMSRFQDYDVVDSDDTYPDIQEHWAKEYILCTTLKGWFHGYPDGTFRPANKITRAETVRAINNMLSRRIDIEDIPDGVRTYTDLAVPPAQTHWAYADIVEASNYHDKFTRKENGAEIWEWPVTGPIPEID